jgi:hypothetical protein
MNQRCKKYKRRSIYLEINFICSDTIESIRIISLTFFFGTISVGIFKIIIQYKRFEVLTVAVKMSMLVFWVATQCG